MPLKILQSWKVFLLIQGLGSLMLIVGANTILALQLFAYVMLFPGSILAAVIPVQSFAWPTIEHLTKSDAVGIQNVLYLPCAVFINASLFYLVRKAVKAYATNRDASQNPQVKNSEA